MNVFLPVAAMRFWPRMLLTILLLAVLCAGVGGYLYRRKIADQWAVYQVGAAVSFDQARREIARLERGPHRDAAIRELVSKWGTGNPQYDLFLARYVDHPQSSEMIREAFSLEFAWREDLLPRWAHYWAWKPSRDPAERLDSIVEFLNVLLRAESTRRLTWREILDLQAVFQLTGRPDLALRLKPENWRERYVRWQQERKAAMPRIARPEKPFPDWEGPIPP